MLASLEHTVKKDDPVSPSIDPKLADLVTPVLDSGMEEKKLDALYDKIARPKNCPAFTVPKINPEIWNNIGGEPHNQDGKAQKVIKGLTKALTPLLKIQHQALQWVKSGGTFDPEQLVTDISDSITILAANVRQINANRREALRSIIQPQFQRLCSASMSVGTNFLFGNDLAKEVKEMDDTSKLVKKITIGKKSSDFQQGSKSGG